jgi:hypothetical protein
MNNSTATSNRIAVLASSAGVIMMLLFAGCAKRENGNDVEADFRAFLETYVQEIKQRNTEYLVNVHPDLPADMHDFFLEATQSMMKYADEQGIEPTIECREYNVCKVTWPQPGGSWAAQSFIRHEGVWRFLPG